jgi:hypothetical protein
VFTVSHEQAANRHSQNDQSIQSERGRPMSVRQLMQGTGCSTAGTIKTRERVEQAGRCLAGSMRKNATHATQAAAAATIAWRSAGIRPIENHAQNSQRSFMDCPNCAYNFIRSAFLRSGKIVSLSVPAIRVNCPQSSTPPICITDFRDFFINFLLAAQVYLALSREKDMQQ